MTELVLLDRERQEALAHLHSMETMQKYRELQSYLTQYEKELADLRNQLQYLDRAAASQRLIDDLKRERDEFVDQIRTMVRTGNEGYSAIRAAFSEYAESVLNTQVLLTVRINTSGNLVFSTRVIDRDRLGRETSEGRGTSYKKVLCACFDLAVLSAYAEQGFYRFVYHDGVFEGLDNRKKVNLLELVRRICAEKGIQYILTVIDSDVPRDERDRKVFFTSEEIIRELHDEGDDGRLFRIPPF